MPRHGSHLEHFSLTMCKAHLHRTCKLEWWATTTRLYPAKHTTKHTCKHASTEGRRPSGSDKVGEVAAVGHIASRADRLQHQQSAFCGLPQCLCKDVHNQQITANWLQLHCMRFKQSLNLVAVCKGMHLLVDRGTA